MDGHDWVRPTSCAPLLCAKVDLCTGRDPALEASLHRVLLVYPLQLHPAARRCGGGPLGLVDVSGRRGEFAKVVEHPYAEHAVLGAVCVLRAPATCVMLEIEHDVARGRRDASRLRLLEVGTRIRDGCNDGL